MPEVNIIQSKSFKTILREEFGIVSKFYYPQEEKQSGLPLPSYINFSPLTAIFSWKKSQNYTEKNTNLGTV